MSEKEIKNVFLELGIEIKEIQPYYTPEEFGRKLLHDNDLSVGEVSYAGRAYRDNSEKNTTAVYG